MFDPEPMNLGPLSIVLVVIMCVCVATEYNVEFRVTEDIEFTTL